MAAWVFFNRWWVTRARKMAYSKLVVMGLRHSRLLQMFILNLYEDYGTDARTQSCLILNLQSQARHNQSFNINFTRLDRVVF